VRCTRPNGETTMDKKHKVDVMITDEPPFLFYQDKIYIPKDDIYTIDDGNTYFKIEGKMYAVKSRDLVRIISEKLDKKPKIIPVYMEEIDND
jgi:hypothetical protein